MNKKNGNKPIYLQARDDILSLIISGNYKVGDLIPSVREISKSLQYTKICIQNAVKLLALEGILENLPRKGCYVKTLPPRALTFGGLDLEDNKVEKPESDIPGTKKLRVGILGEMEKSGNLWKEIFLRYMSCHPGIHIELIDIRDLNEYQGTNEIDILQIPSDRLSEFAETGLLFDIEGNGEKLDINKHDFFPGFMKVCYHKDKLWGTPSSAGTNCFFYNTKYSELLQPLTKNMQLKEYLETCQKISRKLPKETALTTNWTPSFILKLLDTGVNVTPGGIFDEGNIKKLKATLQDLAPYLLDRKIFYLPPVLENRQESRMYDFLSERTVMTQGSSSWLYTFDYQKPFTWGILPLPQIPHGNGSLYMQVISNYTLFPLECIDMLNYLGSSEVQSLFAENGCIIAHRQASKKLKIPGFENGSLSLLNMTIANTEVFNAPDSYYYEYLNLIFLSELLLWQNGNYDMKQFLENLQKKTRYYYRAKRIQEK